MNLKRALMIALAALLVPGLAMAGNGGDPDGYTVRFTVTKEYMDSWGSDDQAEGEAPVQVTLTCNTGSPLEQDAMLDPAGPPVVFVVNNMSDVIPGDNGGANGGNGGDEPPIDEVCEITEAWPANPPGLGDYRPFYQMHTDQPKFDDADEMYGMKKNHIDANWKKDWPESCLFIGFQEDMDAAPTLTDRGDGHSFSASIGFMNFCHIRNWPVPVDVTVGKDWDIGEASDYDAYAVIVVKADRFYDEDFTSRCPRRGKGGHGGPPGVDDDHRGKKEKCVYLHFEGLNPKDQTVTIVPGYNGGDGVEVEFMERLLDSSVETSNDCGGSVDVLPGDNSQDCDFTNVLFFEGIPTLSQYGLAIMALLMLGVGFVGFRRFV